MKLKNIRKWLVACVGHLMGTGLYHAVIKIILAVFGMSHIQVLLKIELNLLFLIIK